MVSKRTLIIIIVILLITNAGVVYLLGPGNRFETLSSVRSIKRTASFAFKSSDTDVEIPELHIQMEDEAWEVIKENRNNALDGGKGDLIRAEHKKYVKATITHDGAERKVKLRLKGDNVDHLWNDKWSYRVKISDGDPILGMSKFSLQHPETRQGIYEWFMHSAYKAADIISLRYKFVQVFVNGKNRGIYAMEEHFNKDMLLGNNKPDGPILKYFEDNCWIEEEDIYRKFGEEAAQLYTGTSLYTDILGFEEKRLGKDSLLSNYYLEGVARLHRFRQGEIPAKEAFDVEKMGMFMAMADLTGTYHNTMWINMRFYYNPESKLLEPVAFDGNFGDTYELIIQHAARNHGDGYMSNEVFLMGLFNDEDISKAYVSALSAVSKTEFLDALVDEIDTNKIIENLTILHKEFKDETFDINTFYNRQKFIAKSLDPAKPLYAYYDADQDQMAVRLANAYVFPLRIHNISIDGEVLQNKLENRRLSGHMSYAPLDYTAVKIGTIPDAKDIRIYYSIEGLPDTLEMKVDKWKYGIETNIESESNIDEFPFLQVNTDTKVISVKPGDWQISKDLIIPGGYYVEALNPFTIDLQNNSKITSYSPITVFGGEEEQTVFYSSDGTGRGVELVDCKDRSMIANVEFRFASEASAIVLKGSKLQVSETLFACPQSKHIIWTIDSECSLVNSTLLTDNGRVGNVIASEIELRDCRLLTTDSIALTSQYSNIAIQGSSINENKIDKSKVSMDETSFYKSGSLPKYSVNKLKWFYN